MQTFISKYGLAAHLALLAVTPLLLNPFCGGRSLSITLLWMALIGAIWIVMEPSRRADERLHEARIRVRGAVIRDPVFWLFTVLICFAAVRCFNGDIVRIYDTREARWMLNDPLATLFPRAAEGTGLQAFSLAVAMTVVVSGCRQALGKSARAAFAATVALAVALLSLVLVHACRQGHAETLALAGQIAGAWPEDGLPVHSPLFVSSMGDAFGISLLASIAATAGIFECRWNKFLLLFSFAVGGTFTGLFYFSTPATFFLYAVLAVLAIVACCFYLALTQRLSVLLKFLVAILIAGAVPALVIIAWAPKEMTEFRVRLLQGLANFPGGLFPADFWARRSALSAHAKAFWDESHWLGQGIGSYPLNLWLAGAAKTGLAADGTLNAWWLLLAERGIIGALSMLLPLAFMTASLVFRIIGALGRHVFLPLPVLGVAAVLSLLISSCFGCSVWRMDVLLIAGAFYAVAASSFPVSRKPAEEDDAGK